MLGDQIKAPTQAPASPMGSLKKKQTIAVDKTENKMERMHFAFFSYLFASVVE